MICEILPFARELDQIQERQAAVSGNPRPEPLGGGFPETAGQCFTPAQPAVQISPA